MSSLDCIQLYGITHGICKAFQEGPRDVHRFWLCIWDGEMVSRADCPPRLPWFSSCGLSEGLFTYCLSQKSSESIERPLESFLWPQGDQPTAPWEFLTHM